MTKIHKNDPKSVENDPKMVLVLRNRFSLSTQPENDTPSTPHLKTRNTPRQKDSPPQKNHSLTKYKFPTQVPIYRALKSLPNERLPDRKRKDSPPQNLSIYPASLYESSNSSHAG